MLEPAYGDPEARRGRVSGAGSLPYIAPEVLQRHVGL